MCQLLSFLPLPRAQLTRALTPSPFITLSLFGSLYLYISLWCSRTLTNHIHDCAGIIAPATAAKAECQTTSVYRCLSCASFVYSCVRTVRSLAGVVRLVRLVRLARLARLIRFVRLVRFVRARSLAVCVRFMALLSYGCFGCALYSCDCCAIASVSFERSSGRVVQQLSRTQNHR